jgi:hypothetical protein
MSRFIDDNKPLSDDDRAYLLERSLKWKVDEIDRRFPPDHVPQPRVKPEENDLSNLVDPTLKYDLNDFDESLQAEVKGLKVSELQAELKDLGVGPTTGHKNELQWRLAKAVSLTEKDE